MSPSATATRNPMRRATWAPLTAYGSKVIEKWIISGPTPTPTVTPTRSTLNLVESPEPAAAAEWAPLTRDEALALMRSERYPGRAPPPMRRPAMPRAELNRLSRKVACENTMRRTHQVIREVQVGPATPDQRILHNFRRKSYSAASNQVEPRDLTPLW